MSDSGLPLHPYEMLRNVSRTFALSIDQLPGIMRDAITLAYLLFRVADCIEDHANLPAGEKAALLTLWANVVRGDAGAGELHSALQKLDGRDPEVYVAQHAGDILQRLQSLPAGLREILCRHVEDTSRGMARWQEHGPCVLNEEEMDDYMFQVAGRVGYLLTEAFAWYTPSINAIKDRLMPLGREFGLALQTVNIIRGLRKDYERGWVFVPASMYEPLGLTRDSLFHADNRTAALEIVNKLADKAARHLKNGLTYITLLPRRHTRIRLFCIWPLLFAVKTLAISRNDTLVLTEEKKISRRQVIRIMQVSSLFGWSNTWLKWYYTTLSRSA
jgi:farnesyl-diphosphate farnesyltransferase